MLSGGRRHLGGRQHAETELGARKAVAGSVSADGVLFRVRTYGLRAVGNRAKDPHRSLSIAGPTVRGRMRHRLWALLARVGDARARKKALVAAAWVRSD